MSLLQDGVVEDAISTLKEAICLIRDIYGSEQKHEDRSDPARRKPLRESHLCDPSFGTCEASRQDQQRYHGSGFMQNEHQGSNYHASIYSGAFVFNEEFCSQFHADTAAMMLFNLGLASHLSVGYLDPANSSKKMESALHLYKLSMATLNQHTNVQSPLLAMALLTNMRNILSTFLRHSEANECLHALENYLSDPVHAIGIADEDLRFFYYHITYSSACKQIVAAAA